MSDILIQGMELPKKDGLLSINIWPSGSVTIAMDLECKPVARAVELPPHGDLIDSAAFACISYKGTEGLPDTFDYGVLWLLDKIDNSPVTIPATEEASS